MKLTATTERRLQTVLIAVSSACVIIGVAETHAYRAAPGKIEEVSRPVTGRLAPVTEALMPPRDVYSAIAERPLFMEDRRPYQPPADIPDVAPKEPLRMDLVLSAVVLADDRQIAIIQAGAGRPAERLAVGDSLEGWTLAEVLPRSVRLVRGDEERQLDLMAPSATPAVRRTVEAPAAAATDPVADSDPEREVATAPAGAAQ